MKVQPIGSSGAAIFCGHEDLSRYGFVPAALTLDQALRLVRDACPRLGPITELELYPGALGVLIFAHLLPGRRGRFPYRGRVRRHSG